MRAGDGAILAALLGVGVVLSPVFDRPRAASAVEAGRGSIAGSRPFATATEAGPRGGGASVAGGASGAAPAIAPESSSTARRASGSASALASSSPSGPGALAPEVVEAPEGEALARFEAVHDRGLALTIDGAGGIASDDVRSGDLALDGRSVLVHVAASWCRPCAAELARFLALAARAERAVLVMAEDIGGPAGLAAVAEGLADRALPASRPWPAGLELRADPAWAWARWLGRDALPLTAVIAADGALRLVASGPLDADAAARVAALTEAPSEGVR